MKSRPPPKPPLNPLKLYNFSLAAKEVIYVTATITPPKNTKIKRYNSQECIILPTTTLMKTQFIIKSIAREIGCLIDSEMADPKKTLYKNKLFKIGLKPESLTLG